MDLSSMLFYMLTSTALSKGTGVLTTDIVPARVLEFKLDKSRVDSLTSMGLSFR